MGERRGLAEEPGPDPTRHAVIWSTWYHPVRAQGLGFSSPPEPRGHEGRSKSDPVFPPQERPLLVGLRLLTKGTRRDSAK